VARVRIGGPSLQVGRTLCWGVVSIDLKGFSEGRNGEGTYRTCSTTLVLFRIVVGTLEFCCDWDEEYGCLCLSDTITPNGVLFCKVTGLRRIHWLFSVIASNALALTMKEMIWTYLAVDHAWMHHIT
jgi:hypothetical protein